MIKKINKNNVKVFSGANGNVYSATRKLYYNIKPEELVESVTYSSYDTLTEGIVGSLDMNNRGVIVFSTDVNSVQLSDNKIANWFKQKLATISNRLNKDRKINKVLVGDNKLKETGWTIGRFLQGRYVDKAGHIFDENSLSVEVDGIDSKELISIAEDLCKEFKQETVLLKDYNTGNIYFIDEN